jgi:hypothetical protein
LTSNIFAQSDEKIKYAEIKKTLIDKTFENKSNGERSYIKISKPDFNGILKVIYKDDNNEYTFQFVDGYYLNGFGKVSFDFSMTNNPSLYGTAYYNYDKKTIDITRYNLPYGIKSGNYSLVEEDKMKELDGMYSKRTKLLNCEQKPMLRSFSNQNKYIYLYKDGTADFVNYNSDSSVYDRKSYNIDRSIENNNGKITNWISFTDKLKEIRLPFIIESGSLDNPIKLKSYKDGTIFVPSPEMQENDYIKTGESIVEKPGLNLNADWLKTPIDLLKSNEKEIIKIYNYFFLNLQPNEINRYYNEEKVDGQSGRKYKIINPFESNDYSVEIDEEQNIIYLIFKSKTNRGVEIYAMHPILGPLPFIKSDSPMTYFGSYKSFYKPTKDLKEFDDYYVLALPETGNELYAYRESIQTSFKYKKENLNKSINGSVFYLEELQIGTMKETFKYVPSQSEKLQLYNASAISSSQFYDSNFYTLKTEDVAKYGEFLLSITGFNLFFSSQIEEFFPLQNGYGIFKYKGKFGVVDLKDEKWKNKNFITVENSFDDIKYIKPNVLKGIGGIEELFFDYNGNILSKQSKDYVPPKKNVEPEVNTPKDNSKIEERNGIHLEQQVVKKEDAASLSAKIVIDNYIKAIGGENAVASVKTLMMIGSYSIPQMPQQQLIFTNKVDSKGKLLIEIAMGETSVFKQLVNEKEAYVVQQGERKNIDGAELVEMKASAILFEELILSNKLDLEVSGIETINGYDAYGIVNGKTTLYYDVKSGLKIARITTVEKDGNKTKQITYFKDYKVVKGVKVPFNIIQNAGFELNIKMFEVKINEGVSDADFQ